tara:strand:+ start:617 stop:1048 length:432 start_codon:yes stop_codon:yes gene_type:complete
VKKKISATLQDKKDWAFFTKNIGEIKAKEFDSWSKNIGVDKINKLDLHGFSLVKANELVNKFIIKSYNKGCRKILVITGKGLRSKAQNNPYISEKLNTLKYSVPDYIKNNANLISKIKKISSADIKDGGEGAIYIFLKKNKKL